MLNDALYKALHAVFGEAPRVVNEGEQAQVEYPIPVLSFLDEAVTQIPASKVHRGEQYCVCCPFCGDKRYRLYFSYLWDTVINTSGGQYHCSENLVRCFNEDCQRVASNKSMILTQLRSALADKNLLSNTQVASADTESRGSLENHVPLPDNLRSINDPLVPSYVRDYWVGERGFDADTLEHYGVRFTYLNYPIKAGAPICQQMVTIIPVVQEGKYWFYQIRLIPIGGKTSQGYERDQLGMPLPKYIIPHGSRKGWSLYNIDNACNYSTVYIVEGVSDVWRVGDAAVARFGKTLSRAQTILLKERLFGKRLVIVPDMDDDQAFDEALRQSTMLKNTGVFSDVVLSVLDRGVDPGDLRGNKEEVRRCLEKHISSQVEDIISHYGSQELLY